MTDRDLVVELLAPGVSPDEVAVGDLMSRELLTLGEGQDLLYALEAMREKGLNLGGEQSGHIVMTDYATTGDGLIGALQFLACMVETGRKASALSRVFDPVPQKLINLRYQNGQAPLESDEVQEAIARGEKRLGSDGRLLIRKSGTEPLIRVMGESIDPSLLDQVLGEVVDAVERAGLSSDS